MDLGTAVRTLSSEMGIELEAGETIPLGENVTGARLYSGDRLYGALALITDDSGDLQSCAYLGEYPGQTSVERPFVGKRDQVSLDLDTRHVSSRLEDTSGWARLVRVDHNNVSFLGTEYDGWDVYDKNRISGPATKYAERLFEQ